MRDVCAERNVAGLIKYAKEITGDLDAFKEQVAFSEKVVEDLKSSGKFEFLLKTKLYRKRKCRLSFWYAQKIQASTSKRERGNHKALKGRSH